MPPFPIRTRLAPIALVIAFAFVIIGFIRADREMVRTERERASLLVSETATLVEAFLWRQLDHVRSASLLLQVQARNDTTRLDSLSTVVRRSPELEQFQSVFVVDSQLVVRGVFLKTSPGVASDDSKAEIAFPISVASRVRSLTRTGKTAVFIDIDAKGNRTLVFADPTLSAFNRTIVATTTVDSLNALLRHRFTVASVGVRIRSDSAMLLDLPLAGSSKAVKEIERRIEMPFDGNWVVEMTYLPSGRGVQIALWVVGLGAIVGLGIGLVLERREATRIADRSSELEHLSAELLRANRAKSEFLANVSHELRTPLNAIVGFVDLLRDGVYGALNARQVGPVERIEALATHLRHLVDQVLDLAKMAAGRLEVHAEPIELRPFVFDVASEVEPLITEKGLSFSLAVGATLPRVRTDPTHLRQILINLLGNAVKFTTNGGISVRGKLVGTNETSGMTLALNTMQSRNNEPPRPNGVWIALQVADSGVGIPEKDRERIFDEFEQVNAGPRGDSMRRGTGLGLSISRRLARLLGGDISVESELGRGSVFTLWLPVNPADLQSDRAA